MPGLPQGVAALVTSIDSDSMDLEIVNTNLFETRRVVVQGGAYGEHRITNVRREAANAEQVLAEERSPQEGVTEIEGRYFQIDLEPGAGTTVRIGLDRFVSTPSYEFPWQGKGDELGEGLAAARGARMASRPGPEPNGVRRVEARPKRSHSIRQIRGRFTWERRRGFARQPQAGKDNWPSTGLESLSPRAIVARSGKIRTSSTSAPTKWECTNRRTPPALGAPLPWALPFRGSGAW